MPGVLAFKAYRLLWTGVDWLFPPSCGGCGKFGTRWCSECGRSVNIIVPPICKKCGQRSKEELCISCQTSTPKYKSLRSWAYFDDNVRNAIHNLKYNRDICLGDVFAIPMINLLKNQQWEIDLIAPVPLGLARFAERGYNQSSLLAIPIALNLGIHYNSKAIARIRETKSQVDLPFELRKQNVKGAFTANRDLVDGKTVLIVDDVATSGATLDACSEALMSNGADKVYGITLTRSKFVSSTDVDFS
jgi:ComF family protein